MSDRLVPSGPPHNNRRRKLIIVLFLTLGFLVVLIPAFLISLRNSSRLLSQRPIDAKIVINSRAEASRFPTIEAPEAVSANQEFSVQVSLTKELETPEAKVIAGPTTNEGRIGAQLPPQDVWEISVVLSANGFDISNGENQRTIILPKDQNSSPVVFELRAKPVGAAKKIGKVFATFYFKSAFVGRAMREIQVYPGPVVQGSRSGTTNGRPGVSDLGSADTNSSFPPPDRIGLPRDSIEPSRVPDLTVYIRDYGAENRTGMSDITIISPRLQIAASSFKTPEILSSWLKSKYRDLARLSTSNIPQSVRHARAEVMLRGLGRELYQKFAPPAFKDAFWKLMDESLRAESKFKFRTIQIYSDNPILPWELMRPVRENGTDERDFLGVEFSIGRWHVNEGTSVLMKPPDRLAVLGLYVIAPDYRDGLSLSGQQQEVEALHSFPGYQSVKAKSQILQQLINSEIPGIIHFAGHAVIRTSEDTDEYCIVLEDGEIDPLAWRGMINTPTANSAHDFVFFNACDVGKVMHVANFVDGWAPAVLETGASGYVGALWPLDDKSAAHFSIRFYQLLLGKAAYGPVAVSDVLRETRAMYLDEHDPSYLAYVYYGDPNLELFVR